MKKVIAFCFAILLLSANISAFAADSFSFDPAAIEQAAKSVLMLEVFDADNQLIATGSGFVAFDNRTLITNHHVIEDAEWMMGNSDSGDQYIVNKILIVDQEKDIAICRFMSPTDLSPLPLNTDGELKRAERIVAIGSPIGITNTVSLGNISALYNDQTTSLIQFTAPISHGSSGGALFDDCGEVIGVTSGSYAETQNLNVAVHISEVTNLYQEWNGIPLSFKEGLSASPITTPSQENTIIPYPTPTLTPRPLITPKPTPAPKYKMLMLGDRGDEVKKLQQALIDLNFFSGKADGIFNEKTAEAVEAFNKQHGLSWGRFATNETQILLYEGSSQVYEDPDIVLSFRESSRIESQSASDNQLKVRFQLTNTGKQKTVTSFDLYAYATDKWGQKLHGTVWGIYYDTTTKNIAPGKSAYSNYITLPKRSEISRIYCGIRKVTYSDGDVCIIPHSEIEYTYWDYR